MPSAQIDFLIIGQGLAGSILAFKLLQAGRSVLVLDNKHRGSASKVAAGIVNPVTGHRLNITQDFFKYLEVAEPFYSSLEAELSCKFYRKIKQQRLIKNPGQREYLEQRLGQADYQGLIEPEKHSRFKDEKFGTISVSKTSVMDVPSFLSAVKEYLDCRNSFEAGVFDHAQLQANESGFEYQSIDAKRVVFCEGYQAIHNPLLSTLPFKLAKGEVLTIDHHSNNEAPMLSWGNWLVPNSDSAKLGSNFIWNDLSENKNPATVTNLLNSLKQTTGIEAQCIDHQTGIRPTTKHRVPFVGPISSTSGAYCFNGFGSKGCLTMPYYADLLLAHLLQEQPLPTEVCQWL